MLTMLRDATELDQAKTRARLFVAVENRAIATLKLVRAYPTGEPPAAAVALLNELNAAVTHWEQMIELRKTDMKIATKELEVATHACSILKEYRCVEIP